MSRYEKPIDKIEREQRVASDEQPIGDEIVAKCSDCGCDMSRRQLKYSQGRPICSTCRAEDNIVVIP